MDYDTYNYIAIQMKMVILHSINIFMRVKRVECTQIKI